MFQNKVSLNHFNYEGHIAQKFKQMLIDEAFTDVTLVCEDERQLKAHRVVLSSSSSVLKGIFDKNNHQHPLVFLSDITSQVMENILEFIYTGQVQVEQTELEKFMKISTKLKVYGLMSDSGFTENTRTRTVNSHTKEYDQSRRVVIAKPENKDSGLKQEHVEEDEPNINPLAVIHTPDDQDEVYENIDEKVQEVYDTIEEKVNCAMCNKEFENASELKTHVLTHKKMKEPKFKCDQCSKMFTTKAAMDRHSKGLHEGVRYSCDKCEYNAAQQQSLRFHKINYHPVQL